MDLVQVLNNIVLGLSRLGDFVAGWDAIKAVAAAARGLLG